MSIPNLSRRRTQAGNSMVELALVCAVLLPFVTGIFQFGYGFFGYNRLVSGVRSGARYASLLKYDSATTTPSTGFQSAVRNMVVYGDPAGGTNPLISGLSPTQVNVSVTMINGAPDTVTVSVSSFTLDTIFKRFVFVNKPVAAFRYSGVFAPL